MNILFLNQYYPPDTAATAYVAQMYASALGEKHKVTVLAGRPSYSPVKRYPWRLSHKSRDGKLLVERVGSTSYERNRMKGRVLNYLSYLTLMTVRALTIKTDALLCMTDPPLTGIAGAIVATLRRCPFVYCIQDLHPDMALASNLIYENTIVWIWEKLHRWALRRADMVIVLGADMRQHIISKGIEQDKIKVVRLGASPSSNVVSCNNPTVSELRCGFPFTVIHAGNLGFYGAWETLIEVARLLEDRVGFIFIGDGAARARIEQMASSQNNVRFLPFRPREEIPHVMAAGDLHVVTIKRGLEGLVVPSKLYTILAAGRPVLAVAPESSDVAQIVLREGCGVVADPDDPKEVCRVVESLITHPEGIQKLSERAFRAARKYRRTDELRNFVRLVESVLNKDL
ncbi:MAG: glycosyltransferase family 4 protein [Deltaproteobacteria bacterium]|nr:glycosyltransferase family 4 protein [Deltaproteobacteria bacterium]MBW2026860.1 glycosyltransferase family 4 protein [Deltaproteobacteria bacterium]MBW2126001.1 glycosyltransferase family 4 protein [Deltaproteobacteria bacterium]